MRIAWFWAMAACVVLPGASGAQAQAPVLDETVDILAYKIPKAWTKSIESGRTEYVAVNPKTGGYAKVGVYRAVPSLGNIDKDFEAEWRSVVAGPLKVAEAPVRSPARIQDMDGLSGVAKFEFNGRRSTASLTVLSDKVRRTSVVVLTNSEEWTQEIGALLASLKPIPADRRPAPDPVAKVESAPIPVAKSVDARVLARWQRSGAVAMDFENPGYWGARGYTTARYEFQKDGTYHYTVRSFRAAFQHITLIKETGTFTGDAGTITVVPTRSVIEAYTKKNGADELGTLVKSQARGLETATYRYRFHFFEGIQEWNLVLQADKPTARDGSFSTNTTFPNAWYFDRRFTEKELTGPRR